MPRSAEIHRKTKETSVDFRIDLNGAPSGNSFGTGVPFFDHMLDAAFRHGRISAVLAAKGDLEIDAHHTLEDTGLAIGQAIKAALGDKTGIRRFGEATIPLDEALARVVIDLSGRPHLSWRCAFPEATAGGVSHQLFHEFFQALANAGGLTIHVDLIAGDENHHCLEAIFKAFGRALGAACATDPRLQGETPSTKGVLE